MITKLIIVCSIIVLGLIGVWFYKNKTIKKIVKFDSEENSKEKEKIFDEIYELIKKERFIRKFIFYFCILVILI